VDRIVYFERHGRPLAFKTSNFEEESSDEENSRNGNPELS
jgi:hypothetical protein